MAAKLMSRATKVQAKSTVPGEGGRRVAQAVPPSLRPPRVFDSPPGIEDARPLMPRRGRGAQSNASGRFEPLAYAPVDDGWAAEDELPPLKTSVTWERAKTIITRNESPDISFDRSINPYRGCEHGCVYCFARPTHAYMGLSPGLDFETKLFAKADAAALLERELAAKIISRGPSPLVPIRTPYQPIERQHRVMRQVLEVLARTNHPVGIVTKSALVLRDLDLLAPMAEKGLVKVALSVTSLDPLLARRLEPRAAAPERRLATIKALSEAGVPTCVMVAPVIPAPERCRNRNHSGARPGCRGARSRLCHAAPATRIERPLSTNGWWRIIRARRAMSFRSSARPAKARSTIRNSASE